MDVKELEELKLLLETQKLQREIEKIDTEVRALAYQQSPWGRRLEWFKSLAGFGAAATGIVALLGLWFSIAQWQNGEERTRSANIQVQLSKAFDNLSDPSVGKRLSGLATLRYFLTNGKVDVQRQILQVTVNLLAIEKEEIVRDSMLSLFKSVDNSKTEVGVLNETLAQLVSTSRTLVIHADLLRKRTLDYRVQDPTTEEAIAASIGQAMALILHQGANLKDFSGIYCLNCDFSKLSLSNAKFDNAMLYLSDFSGSNLQNASFDGADLEHTRFVGAEMSGAKLTFFADNRPDADPNTYVGHLIGRASATADGATEQVSIYGPNFDCANLTMADFEGHPLFGFVSSEAKMAVHALPGFGDEPPIWVVPASFRGAILNGTKFESAHMFVSQIAGGDFPFGGRLWDGISSNDRTRAKRGNSSFEGPFNNNQAMPKVYEKSFESLRESFAGSNWRDASLPQQIRERFDEKSPSKSVDNQTSPCPLIR